MLNLYDKKIAKRSKCGKTIGEVEIDSKIVFLVCRNCENKNHHKVLKNKPELKYDFLNKRMIETVPS